MPVSKSPRPIYREATQAAALGLVVNLGLGIVKLVGGIVGGSFALVSDSVNSLGDSLASIVVLCGLWYAQRPPDAEHPYGHTRAEAIAASNVALVVILSGLYIGWEALWRLTEAHSVPPVWTLWIAAANVVIKESLYRYKSYVGRKTGSASVVANAWDHRSDALCSGAVFIGLAAIRWGGPAYIWADEVAALVVVGAILFAGVRLFRSSAHELMDPQGEPAFVDEIRAAAQRVAGVRGIEKLWVRKTGLEYLADIHVEVDAELTVRESHEIAHRVKDELLAEFASLRDVLVHVEPHGDCDLSLEIPSSKSQISNKN